MTGVDVGLHLHDTRGTALLNLYVALVAGVTRFDTAIGGLGGSPFAPGAGGNVATEEVVALLDDLDSTWRDTIGAQFAVPDYEALLEDLAAS